MVASHRSEQILRSWNRSRGGCLVWNDAAFNKGMTIAAQQPRMICKYVKHCYLFIIESQDQNWGAYSLYLSPVSFKKDVTTISDTSWNSQWWNLNLEISCIGFLFPSSRTPHITCSNPDIAAGLFVPGLGSTFRRASTSLGCHPAVWGRSHQEAPSGRQPGGNPKVDVFVEVGDETINNLSVVERRRRIRVLLSVRFYWFWFVHFQ